jgi:hypothetical protein
MPKVIAAIITMRAIRFALIRALAVRMPVALNIEVDGVIRVGAPGLVQNITCEGGAI